MVDPAKAPIGAVVWASASHSTNARRKGRWTSLSLGHPTPGLMTKARPRNLHLDL